MDRALEQYVWSRAKYCCEYCQFPLEYAKAPLQIDHIIAHKHGGLTVKENLALSCYYRNSYKGPNIAGLDAKTGKVVRLFHPPRDRWRSHFRWTGGILVGRSAVGRATVAVLVMNHPAVVAVRKVLIEGGLFPPSMKIRK